MDNKLLPDLERCPFDSIDLCRVLPRFLSFASWTAEQKSGLAENLVAFAKFLMDDLGLSLKASVTGISQGTPTILPRPPRSEDTTTSGRCIMIQKFDAQKAQTCSKRHGCDVRNDDGQPLYWSQELTIRSRR